MVLPNLGGRAGTVSVRVIVCRIGNVCNVGSFSPPGRFIDVKVRPSVKPICEKCKVIKRKGAVMIICENPKHKQKQG